MSSDGDDLVATLHRRADLLGLLTDESRAKQELIDELEVSRSTVDRALRELETANCITREDGAFVATAVGRVLLETYESHYAQVDGVSRAADVLVNLPRSAPLSPELLAGARVLRPDPPDPHTAYEELEAIITSARRFRGISVASTHFRFPGLLRDRTVEAGVPMELIGTPEITRLLHTDFREPMHEAMTDGQLDLYKREDLPFGMLLGEHDESAHVAIVVYGPRSDLAGIILNDTPEAITWARLLYRHYRQEATPVDPASLE
jgi:predicted transcriptional regulator